jgi:hypothetical protein
MNIETNWVLRVVLQEVILSNSTSKKSIVENLRSIRIILSIIFNAVLINLTNISIIIFFISTIFITIISSATSSIDQTHQYQDDFLSDTHTKFESKICQNHYSNIRNDSYSNRNQYDFDRRDSNRYSNQYEERKADMRRNRYENRTRDRYDHSSAFRNDFDSKSKVIFVKIIISLSQMLEIFHETNISHLNLYRKSLIQKS